MKMKGTCWGLPRAVGQGWKEYIYMKLLENKRFVEDYRAAVVITSYEDLHVSLSGLIAEIDKLKIKAYSIDT